MRCTTATIGPLGILSVSQATTDPEHARNDYNTTFQVFIYYTHVPKYYNMLAAALYSHT